MQIKKDEIKTRILTVSKRLFINNGYEKTSLRMVANKCFISKSNIYRYFKSKEEIYETLVGDARADVTKAISHFGSREYAGNYTVDKIEDVSTVLAKVMSEHREVLLIMLKSEGSKDKAMITEMMTRFFVEACPIEDREFKIQIVSLLIMGLTDILIKSSEEDEMRYRLKLLCAYHYLGLNGIKEKLGIEVS
ncbi:MAG: TetR/AcrR family transcriptional regulator [Eubacterium sp.]|nr:TetR/AcrR family transcriptional regulator [Eubacterium sp.]